jgi:Zn finger protein HypA/HybF involved in hydrogenase expression
MEAHSIGLMHDISVAQAVAGEIIGKLKARGGKARPKRIEISMELGKLRFHDTSQVEFWLNELLKKELGEKLSVKADIKIIEPEIKCRCGYKGKVEDVSADEELSHHGVYVMNCPKCNSDDYELVSGNECRVLNVKVTE